MAFRAGTTTKMYMGTAALTDMSSYMDNTQLSQDSAMLDITAFGTADTSYIPGLNSASFSVSGPSDSTAITLLRGARAAGSLIGFVYGPAGSVAGQVRSAGSLFVANITDNTTVAGRVEYSATLQVSGAVANGTF